MNITGENNWTFISSDVLCDASVSGRVLLLARSLRKVMPYVRDRVDKLCLVSQDVMSKSINITLGSSRRI